MDHPLILLISVIAGAATQELFWWYNIRHKLTLKRYKNLIRSRGYWITSFAMVLVTAAGVMLWKRNTIDNYEALDFFVFGVAIPILIKELVSIAGKKERKIGAYSSSSINSYFLMGVHD
jgi:hypothetical protein